MGILSVTPDSFSPDIVFNGEVAPVKATPLRGRRVEL
jgi:hypothetical protein